MPFLNDYFQRKHSNYDLNSWWKVFELFLLLLLENIICDKEQEPEWELKEMENRKIRLGFQVFVERPNESS